MDFSYFFIFPQLFHEHYVIPTSPDFSCFLGEW